MNTQPIHTLLQKNVSRREFLLYAGILLLTITGLLNIINTLKYHTGSGKTQTQGYGSTPYGK